MKWNQKIAQIVAALMLLIAVVVAGGYVYLKSTGFEQFALDVFRQFQIFGYLFNDFTRRSGTAKFSERIEQGTEETHELGTLDAF